MATSRSRTLIAGAVVAALAIAIWRYLERGKADDTSSWPNVARDDVGTAPSADGDSPLHHCDEPRALEAIDRLRAAHSGAGPMADRLKASVRNRSVSDDVLVEHSRWCNTAGPWASGVEPARDAAMAMYGFVPERLMTGEGVVEPDMRELLAQYREQLSG